MSIRAKLLSLILLISFIPVLIIGYFKYSDFKTIVEHQTRDNLASATQDKHQKIELFLLALKTRVQDFSSDGFVLDSLQRFQYVENIGTIKSTVKQHLLNNKQVLDERIMHITLFDQHDRVVVSTADANSERNFSEAIEKNREGILFSDLFVDAETGGVVIDVLALVYSRTDTGKYFGSVLIRFDASMMADIVSTQLSALSLHEDTNAMHFETAVSYLVNGQGQMLRHPRMTDKAPLLIVVDSPPVKACLNDARGMNGSWLDYAGVAVIGSSSCVEMGRFRWALISEVNAVEALALVSDYQRFLGLLVLVVLSIVFVVAFYLTKVVSGPIKLLNDGVKRIAAGNLSFTVGTSRQDEIGELSRSFDLMLVAIKQSKHEIEAVNSTLEQANQELNYVKNAMDRHAVIVETDSSGVITYANEKFCDISQYAAAELVGQSHSIVSSGYHPQQFFEQMWQTISSGRVWHGDVCNRRKDGEVYWVNTTIVPYLNEHGKVERYIALRTDISEQKKVQEKLLRLNRRLLASVNIEKVIMAASDELSLLADACQVLVEDAGYSHAWVGYVMHDVVKSIKPVAQFGYADDYLDFINVRWGDDELGRGPAGIAVRSGSEIVVRDVATDDEFAPWYEQVASLGTKGIVCLPLRDGKDVFAIVSVHTQESNIFNNEEVALLKRLVDDVAYGVVGLRARQGRDRAEAALEKSEENLKRAQEIAKLGSWEFDLVSGKHSWSDELYYLLGYQPGSVEPSCDEILKMICLPERDQVAADLSSSIENLVSRNMEFSITRVDGELRHIRSQLVVYAGDDGKPNRVAGTLLDITDQKQAENERESLHNQLLHAQKLDSIGQLTGGVAHDFNNILSSIMGYTSLAIEECPENNQEFLGYLEEVSKAGTRAKELISQLMAFSRRETKEAELLSLAELVTEALNMLKPTIPAAVELNSDINEDLPLIRASAVQIHQVLTNLVINASDAIQEFGKVDIRLQTRRMEACLCTSCQQLFSGGFIELSVTDTGEGIAEQDLVRMFEPFFTTKELGKGTGMGLAMVHGLLHSHEGHLVVKSTPGQGSCFSLYFPYERALQKTPPPVIDALPAVNGQRSGAILVVDDDVQISRMLCALLTRRGYECAESNSAEHALQLFDADPDRFDLVVTDQMMPKMTGMEMAAQLLAKRPGLGIVLCTGYSGRINNDDVKKAGLIALVDKPVNLERMMAVIDSHIGLLRR